MTDEEFEHQVKDNWFVHWWKTITREEYQLTVYFASEKEIDEKGRETFRSTPKKYSAKKFYSLKPNYIKFKDEDDQLIEIRTHEPMNWDLVKVY